MSHSYDISSIFRSPMKTRLHFHHSREWSFLDSCPLRAFRQALPCHIKLALNRSLKPHWEKPPHLYFCPFRSSIASNMLKIDKSECRLETNPGSFESIYQQHFIHSFPRIRKLYRLLFYKFEAYLGGVLPLGHFSLYSTAQQKASFNC